MSQKAKRDRKANFLDSEVRALLEGILENKEIIQSKLQSTVTVRKKRDAWGRITAAVNAQGGTLRTEDDCKKKWKDVKSTMFKEKLEMTKTGGGPGTAVKPYNDIVHLIVGDSTAVDGIEVTGTDSYVLPHLELQCVSGMDSYEPQKPPSPMPSTSSHVKHTETAATQSTSSEKSAVGTAAKVKRGSKRPHGAADDDKLFNTWLESEIAKNQAKSQLISLEQYKIGLEIVKLEKELNIESAIILPNAVHTNANEP